MLTPEQIQKLKPGDPLIINGTFVDLDDEGDIEIKISYRLNRREIKGSVYGSPSCVSLPSEIVNRQSSIVNKYAPTRLFRKGDKVRVVEWNGRDIARVGQTGYVVSDEKNCRVELAIEGWTKDVFYPACHLELVTPVEELEPYKLIDSPNTYNIVRDSAMVMTIHKKSHPNLKAAAEAECARLNAEWRKEHADA